ncbi:MAG: hypothetical protein FJW23_09830 [Acidimicrobiia bacterium]|nr:hypothetical protein [Acidimicrobiia bacterium]
MPAMKCEQCGGAVERGTPAGLQGGWVSFDARSYEELAGVACRCEGCRKILCGGCCLTRGEFASRMTCPSCQSRAVELDVLAYETAVAAWNRDHNPQKRAEAIFGVAVVATLLAIGFLVNSQVPLGVVFGAVAAYLWRKGMTVGNAPEN